jgi:hypothetical protein
VTQLRQLLWLMWLLPASCAPNSGTTSPTDGATPAPRKSLSQRLEQKNGYKQDAKGNWVPQTDQRSSFETKGTSPYFQGEYGKNSYKTGEYAKKSWWGNKDYGRQAYAGDTDGSRFQKSSGLDGKRAPEASTSADLPDPYQTGTYATNSAHETGKSAIAKPSDTETDVRRRVYQAPEIMDWRQQRSLSVEQSKGILGH